MHDFGVIGLMKYDFLTLLLVNMAAGMFILSLFFARGVGGEIRTTWAPPFAISGLAALGGGTFIAFAWPLPDVYNMIFGEMSVFYGLLMLGAALAVAKHYDLLGLGVFAIFAGAAALLIGVRILHLYALLQAGEAGGLKITAQPYLSAAGFMLSGAAGILAGLALATRLAALRILTSICFLLAAGLWALTGYMAYWMHMQS
jgi:putative membrane protein